MDIKLLAFLLDVSSEGPLNQDVLLEKLSLSLIDMSEGFLNFSTNRGRQVCLVSPFFYYVLHQLLLTAFVLLFLHLFL